MLSRASGGSVTLSRLWPGRTDRLIIAPHDLRTADATRAAEIYAGRFVFAGKIVNCHGRSIFDLEPPSEDWEVALLGFGWLRHLRAADTALTRANARALVEDWISNPANRRRPLARRADVLARRAISLLSQAPLVLSETDNKFYRRYLRALARDFRYLRYTMLDIPDGVPRLQVLIALCYASLCLANQARHIRSASRKLSDELQRQILPDGGHISRNPGALIDLLIDLLPLRQTFAARNIAPPPALLNAIDRMMPMLRFFRHGDGNFALFNGMGPTAADLNATVLAYDDARGNPVSAEYTDLHPMGNYGVMALGHFVPVPANTEWNPDVPLFKKSRHQAFIVMQANALGGPLETVYGQSVAGLKSGGRLFAADLMVIGGDEEEPRRTCAGPFGRSTLSSFEEHASALEFAGFRIESRYDLTENFMSAVRSGLLQSLSMLEELCAVDKLNRIQRVGAFAAQLEAWKAMYDLAAARKIEAACILATRVK